MRALRFLRIRWKATDPGHNRLLSNSKILFGIGRCNRSSVAPCSNCADMSILVIDRNGTERRRETGEALALNSRGSKHKYLKAYSYVRESQSSLTISAFPLSIRGKRRIKKREHGSSHKNRRLNCRDNRFDRHVKSFLADV